MKGYGQFCPVAKAAEIVAERWTPLVLRELMSGSRRFNQLRRGVPLMSPTLLSQRLRALERAGIVERRQAASGRGAEYRLTAAGEELGPIIEQLGVWGRRWARSQLGPEDLDPGLLMWDMHRRIRTELVPPRRTVLQFEFSDTPAAKSRWWLIIEGGQVDLCLEDPGYDVDLFVFTDCRTMTQVWAGDLPIARAIRSGRIELHGASALRKSFPSWLELSVFAGVGSAKPAKAARA